MFKRILHTGLVCLCLYPLGVYASFIEATMGTAVVNDATAVYNNPAALALVNHPQFVALDSVASFHSKFSGHAQSRITGVDFTGSPAAYTNYHLPSMYFSFPTNNKLTFGVAALANIFNRDTDSVSILRYVQSNNRIQDYEFIPAVAMKLNDRVSVGANMTISRANLLLLPVAGIPGLNIPDSSSRNTADATSYGFDMGILLKPATATLIGLNYRSAVSYRFGGTSTLVNNTNYSTRNYSYSFWTPARTVLTLSQYVTPQLGFVATVQRVQWSIFSNVNVQNVATQIASVPTIVTNAAVPYYYHNSWVGTLGTQYKVTSDWIIRCAATYIQTPASGSYQISNGDSYVAGVSTGYNFSKYVTLDGSYAHTFFKSQSINITTTSNYIYGTNRGGLNAFSLKLTLNA